jgi:uncharacterized protein
MGSLLMHPNADIVRLGYSDFNTADTPSLMEAFDETARCHHPVNSLMAGAAMNVDDTFAQFGQYLEGTGGTFKAALHYVATDDEGRVLGVHHNGGTRNGKRLTTDCCITFTVKNNRIVEGRVHFQHQAHRDAFLA